MKKIVYSVAAGILALCSSFSAYAYTHSFDTVPGDPLHSLQYTLPNGLKVFMTVNKDTPRIQTLIPVRVGGKNDPAETTGLAHYFEHMMFKGSTHFGTRDYNAEKPLLDSIEALFEQHRATTDPQQRAAIYHTIDSLSYLASQIAIPNEYDKLMAGIGASGTNAYTSQDETCYVEEIPANRIEEWAIIQADRFKNPVLRGFHTELETIYEEKNMSLTKDSRKAFDAILKALYPSHPYGTQDVLGTQQHLKNPSITNIKKYHKQWYVPNNMAIIMAGDFDPDYAVDVIEKYFGDMKPNPELEAQRIAVVEEIPFTAPQKVTVKGLDAETTYLAWRIPGATQQDLPLLDIAMSVLTNGKTGLIDKNISVPQRTLRAGGFLYPLTDQGGFILTGTPLEGQTLEQVKDLLLEQVDNLRKGNFDDDLITAIVTNEKLTMQRQLERNSSRASLLEDAFINGMTWKDYLDKYINILNNGISKEDIVRVANKYLGDNNYVSVDKVIGQDDSIVKIPKAQLTPIATNREYASEFLTDVLSRPVTPIEPSFVDFNTALTRSTAKNGQVEVLYTQNTTNDLFTLTYVYDYGFYSAPDLYMGSVFSLLGTDTKSAQELKDALYKLGCSYNLSIGGERSYFTIYGLSQNAPQAIELAEEAMSNAVADKDTWDKYVARTLKSRQDAKKNQQRNFSYLTSYMQYGTPENNPTLKFQPTEEQLLSMDPKAVTEAIKNLNSVRHTAIYYGPAKLDEVTALIDKEHRTPETLAAVPVTPVFNMVEPQETIFYIAPYDSEQLYMSLHNNRGELYNAELQPMAELYNEYFGGSMNSIVFQEMRESRSLAYSAFAFLNTPSRVGRPYLMRGQIATQNDKLLNAIEAFDEIINDMPQSEPAFQLAKDGLDSRLRTDRTIKDNIAWSYIFARDHGLDYDIDEKVFEVNKDAKLKDVVDFQQKHVKDGKYHYAILGRIEDLDIEALKKLGKVVILETEDIFGY